MAGRLSHPRSLHLLTRRRLKLQTQGISFRGMDPSHVALIDIHWQSSSFNLFECDTAVKFGVRVDEFSRLIKRADKKDTVEVRIEDDSMLHIQITNNYKKEYKMRLIESSPSSTPLPKLNFNCKIVLTAVAFDKILSDVQVISDYILIESKQKEVKFSGRGDAGEADIILESGSEGLEELHYSTRL